MRLAWALTAACLLLVLAQPATACQGVPAPHRVSVLDVTTGAERELPEIALGGICGFDPPPFDMDETRIAWQGRGSIMVHDLVSGTTRAVEPVPGPTTLVLDGPRGPYSGDWSSDISLVGPHVYVLARAGNIARVSLDTGERTVLDWPFPAFNGTFALAGPILWAAEIGTDGWHRYVHAYDLDAQMMLLTRLEVIATNGVSDYDKWHPEAFLETGIVIVPPGVPNPTQTYLELVGGHLNPYLFTSPFIGDAQDGSTHLYGIQTGTAPSRRDLVRWSIPSTQAEPITLPRGLGTLGALLASSGDQVVVFLWNATSQDIGPEPMPAPPAGSGPSKPLPALPAILMVVLLAGLAARRRPS